MTRAAPFERHAPPRHGHAWPGPLDYPPLSFQQSFHQVPPVELAFPRLGRLTGASLTTLREVSRLLPRRRREHLARRLDALLETAQGQHREHTMTLLTVELAYALHQSARATLSRLHQRQGKTG